MPTLHCSFELVSTYHHSKRSVHNSLLDKLVSHGFPTYPTMILGGLVFSQCSSILLVLKFPIEILAISTVSPRRRHIFMRSSQIFLLNPPTIPGIPIDTNPSAISQFFVGYPVVIPLSSLVVVKHPRFSARKPRAPSGHPAPPCTKSLSFTKSLKGVARWSKWLGPGAPWGHGRRHAAGPHGFVKVPFPMVPVCEPWGILTYMTGWFWVEMLVSIPAAWSIWDFQRNWLHHRIGSTWAHVWKVNITCLESDFWAHIPPINYHVKMQEMDT